MWGWWEIRVRVCSSDWKSVALKKRLRAWGFEGCWKTVEVEPWPSICIWECFEAVGVLRETMQEWIFIVRGMK